MFRHALLLAGGVEVAGRQCEALLDAALDTSERYFQAFQFVVWAGKSAREALDAAMFDTVGRGVAAPPSFRRAAAPRGPGIHNHETSDVAPPVHFICWLWLWIPGSPLRACPGMTVRADVFTPTTSPARWCWSAPARWAARCWKAGSRSGSIPNKIAMLEPQARRPRSRRSRRAACALNPASINDASVIVIAIKPQDRRDRGADAQAARCDASTVAVSIMAGQDARLSRGRARRLRRSCARCRTRRPRSGAASRSRCRTRKVTQEQRALADTLLARGRRGRMGRGRSADRRRHRRVRLRPGLCVPARRKPRARRRRRGPAGRPCGAARARDRVRARANCCTARRSMPQPCARTSPRRAEPRRRRWAC